MKPYPSIPGVKDCPKGLPCLAFYKYDGSNIRCEWRRKTGWCKFGTRTRLLDTSDPDFGNAIPLFEKTFAEPLQRLFVDCKEFRGAESIIAYFEYFGENSFAGFHDPHEVKELVLLDVNVYKRGFVLPRAFIKLFRDVRIAEVVYAGNLNQDFVHDVQEGKFQVKEGVVAKGVNPKYKKEQHGLWFAKVKTNWWLEELKKRATTSEELQKVLEENLKEQV